MSQGTHLTDEELREWRSLDLTKRVYSLIKEALGKWNEESCLGITAEDSHRLAAQRDGAKRSLQFILSLGVEENVSSSGSSKTRS